MLSSRRELLSFAIGNVLHAAPNRKFSRPLGLQLYSLRREAAKDLPRTLASVRGLGFTELEVGSFFNRTASEFQGLLSANGLRATSLGAGWGQLAQSVQPAADAARTLGAAYVTCSQIPRNKQLT